MKGLMTAAILAVIVVSGCGASGPRAPKSNQTTISSPAATTSNAVPQRKPPPRKPAAKPKPKPAKATSTTATTAPAPPPSKPAGPANTGNTGEALAAFTAAARQHGGAHYATCNQVVPGDWSCTAESNLAIQQARLNLAQARKNLLATVAQGGDVQQAQLEVQQARHALHTPQPDLFATVTYSNGRYNVQFT